MGNFVIQDHELGSGGYGHVFLATSASTPSERAACKVVDTRKMKREAVMREVQLMERLAHEFIIGLLEHVEIESRVFIFMELAPNGELFGRVVKNGSLTEPEARRYFGQLMAAVDHIHKAGVAHRDLKLENVLLSADDRCKVCDFGLAHVYERAADGAVVPAVLTDVCGSKSYAAPEVLGGGGYNGFAADVWSGGICLFGMLAGFFPLDEATSSDWRYTKAMRLVSQGQSLTNAIFGFYQRPCMLSPEVRADATPSRPAPSLPPSALPRRSPQGPRSCRARSST